MDNRARRCSAVTTNCVFCRHSKTCTNTGNTYARTRAHIRTETLARQNMRTGAIVADFVEWENEWKQPTKQTDERATTKNNIRRSNNKYMHLLPWCCCAQLHTCCIFRSFALCQSRLMSFICSVTKDLDTISLAMSVAADLFVSLTHIQSLSNRVNHCYTATHSVAHTRRNNRECRINQQWPRC